jgi:hypothetical protein
MKIIHCDITKVAVARNERYLGDNAQTDNQQHVGFNSCN